MTIPPCYKCENRHVKCHSECKFYKKYKSDLEELHNKQKSDLSYNSYKGQRAFEQSKYNRNHSI